MTVSDLLEERARILDELRAIETLLATRFKWVASPAHRQEHPSPPLKGLVLIGEHPKQQEGSLTLSTQSDVGQSPVPYTELAREWAKESVGKVVTSVDFRKWLERRYAQVAGFEPNRTSIPGAMRALIKEGFLTEVQKGSGRAPAKYLAGAA